MNYFIPPESYHFLFKALLIFFVSLLSFVILATKGTVGEVYKKHSISFPFIGFIYFTSVFLLISLRPISRSFGDMATYDAYFQVYKMGGSIEKGDYLFELLMYFSANYLNAEIFFFLCAFLYFVPLLIACWRLFGRYWPLAFIFICAVLDFYGYAVNGIRNGMAASIFILAITYNDFRRWIYIVIAVLFHKAMILPAIAYCIVQFYAKPRLFLTIWIIILGISLVYSGFGEILASTGLVDDKFVNYLNQGDEYSDQFSGTGFRFDFLIYSLVPIIFGFYLILRKKMHDPFYTKLYCMYLICNAFWLLVIRISFSNRFAYLSWFLMGLVITYPLIKYFVHNKQHQIYVMFLLMITSITVIWN